MSLCTTYNKAHRGDIYPASGASYMKVRLNFKGGTCGTKALAGWTFEPLWKANAGYGITPIHLRPEISQFFVGGDWGRPELNYVEKSLESGLKDLHAG